MKKKGDWILIILIILFFAIPFCSLAMCEPVNSWPKISNSLVFSALPK